MPAYARSFELDDEGDYEIGASVIGPGEPGTYTKESGFLSYYEVSTSCYVTWMVVTGICSCKLNWRRVDTL